VTMSNIAPYTSNMSWK